MIIDIIIHTIIKIYYTNNPETDSIILIEG